MSHVCDMHPGTCGPKPYPCDEYQDYGGTYCAQCGWEASDHE